MRIGYNVAYFWRRFSGIFDKIPEDFSFVITSFFKATSNHEQPPWKIGLWIYKWPIEKAFHSFKEHQCINCRSESDSINRTKSYLHPHKFIFISSVHKKKQSKIEKFIKRIGFSCEKKRRKCCRSKKKELSHFSSSKNRQREMHFTRKKKRNEANENYFIFSLPASRKPGFAWLYASFTLFNSKRDRFAAKKDCLTPLC